MTITLRQPKGFTLMEIVISLGIIGLVIPLILGLLVVSGESGRKASDDTKAAFIARTVMQEIETAQTEKSDLFGDVLPWPKFPAAGERFVLVADLDGLDLKKIESSAYESGVSPASEDLRDAAYLISVKGRFEKLENLPDVTNVSQVEVSIEMPAVASSQNRRKKVFTQLMHPND